MIKKVVAFLLLLLPVYAFSLSRELFAISDIDDKAYYFIKCKSGGLFLGIQSESKHERAPLMALQKNGAHNQQFKTVSHGKYKQIAVRHSGLVLDVFEKSKKNMTRIIQFRSHGGSNQLFHLAPADNKGYFYIVAAHSNKVLDVRPHDGEKNPVVVQTEKRENSPSQLFKFVRVINDEEGDGNIPGEQDEDEDEVSPHE